MSSDTMILKEMESVWEELEHTDSKWTDMLKEKETIRKMEEASERKLQRVRARRARRREK